MYFLPLTQAAGKANNPDYPFDKDSSTYAGALVIQTSRPIPEFEKSAGGTLASITPT
jgi:hypothetical protein